MNKKNKLIIIVISFLFLSCHYYLNMNSVECYLDKQIYNKNEDIIITCSGDFSDYSEYSGWIGVSFCYGKIKNGEVDSENLPSYTLVDGGKFTNEGDCTKGNFYTLIQSDSKMGIFDEKIKIRIDEPGDYRISFIVSCGCGKYVQTTKDFTYDFTVTE